MTTKRRRPTLPLRRWLVLALFVTFFVPVMSVAITIWHLGGEPEDVADPATRRIVEDVALWDDPAWQATTSADLASDGVQFVLYVDGQVVYRSAADPLVGRNGTVEDRVVNRVVAPGSESERVAEVYADAAMPPWERRRWLVPLMAVSALILTLGGIGWFLGRTVVGPLAATSEGARQIGEGNLDVELPPSRVREVAEVNAAFQAMCAALRSALRHQTELEQERRLFIGAVVHDLRTPLFSLRGYLEGLAKGLADTPEKAARYVAVAQEKAEALERLTTDLFEFARLEYLDQAPNRERLDLGVLLRRLVDGLQPQAEAKGVRIMLEESLDGCVVSGDGHMLTRAVENLLDNALRFTPSGGSVLVGCRAEAGGVAFSVADTGAGIPASDLPHLFTPLYRGETSRNRRTGGAGLGLTIARRILLAHGGDLRAANGAGGGAVFTGVLPGAER